MSKPFQLMGVYHPTDAEKEVLRKEEEDLATWRKSHPVSRGCDREDMIIDQLRAEIRELKMRLLLYERD